MTWTIYDTATGEILWHFLGREAAAQAQAIDGRAILAGAHDGDTHWIDAGQPVPRPATGLPASHSLPVAEEWAIADVPEGAEVWTGPAGEQLALAGTVPADGLVIDFPAPGPWRLEIRPPWPWRHAGCDVEVTP